MFALVDFFYVMFKERIHANDLFATTKLHQ